MMKQHFGVCGLLAAVIVAGMPLSAWASGPQGIVLKIEDYETIPEVSEPSLSPDGTRVAFIVTRIDGTANTRRPQLAIVSTSGGTPQTVATGHVEAPSWSPDGGMLAWIVRDDDGIGQLYVAGKDAVAAAWKIDVGGDVQRYAWSKDSRFVALLARSAAEKGSHDTAFEVPDADYLGTSYLARNNGGKPAQLWVAPTRSGDARQLEAVTGFPQDIAWRLDGQALIVRTQPGASVAAAVNASLLSVPIDGGKAKALIVSPSQLGTGSRLDVSDKGAVAFQHFEGADPWTEPNNLAVYRDGKINILTGALDRQVDDFKWLPKSQGLIVQAADHNRTRIWRVSDSGSIAPIDLGDLNVMMGLDTDDRGGIAFVGSSASTSHDLYYLASVKSRPVRLTRFGDVLAGKRLGKVETAAWTSGGFDHDGVVVYPPDYDATKRYPLLVEIHGGPEASATDAFDFAAQLYAANGWIVFQPNYRGSSGQGNKYQAVIVEDLIKGSGEDILAGIDTLLRTLPIDDKRLALTGWSWGGVMTSWLIGQDQRWCAAIPGAMAVDFTAYYDQSETAIWIRTMLGSPYVGNNITRYREASPLTYLGNAVTPTLILHNVGDLNAPVTQSYTLYHALKDRGVDTRMVLRGIDGHGYGDPFSTRQIYSLTLQWLSAKCPGSSGL